MNEERRTSVRVEHDFPRVPAVWTVVVAAVVGAAVSLVVVLFVPGRPEASRPPSEADAPVLDPARVATSAGGAVLLVVAQTPDGERSGTGIAIERGLVVAPASLVAGATSITVRGRFGDFQDAETSAADDVTDIALLRTDARDTDTAVLGTSEFVRPGDPVVVVGSRPGSQTFVVTAAVAALGTQARPRHGGHVLYDAMRLDVAAALVPEGALVVGPGSGTIGAVVGGAEDGGALVVPVDVVRSVVGSLRAGEPVSRPWIGVATDFVDLEGDEDRRGLVVSRVFPDSPARDRLRVGDVVVGVDGDEVEGPGTLLVRTLERAVGDELRLSVLRDGDAVDVVLRVGEQPPTP